MRSLLVHFLAMAASLAGAQLLADDNMGAKTRWPQFRGLLGQGIAGSGMKFPVKFDSKKNVLWKTALPPGHSSPCIWDDRIYLTGFNKDAKKLATIAIARATGKILWRQAAPAQRIENVHQLNTPASATPATDGEQVYVYFASYGMLCYAMDGALKWKRPLNPIPSGFGSGSSPVVAGDLVLLNGGKGQAKFTLLALDRRTGKTVWEKDRPRGFSTGLWSTPVVRPVDGGHEVIVAGGKRLEAYKLADGSPRWQVAGLPLISLSSPAVGDGLVFVTLTNPVGNLDENVVKLPPFDEMLKKYDKNKDGKLSADEVPDDLVMFDRGRPDKIGNFGKVREGMARYDRDRDKALNREEWEAMLKAVTQFTTSLRITVAAVRLDGKGDVGKTHLSWQESKRVPEVPSPLYHGGRLYLVSEKGIVTCRNARTGKEIYRERLGGRGVCYASPVLGDGKIYAGTDGGALVVFKAGDKLEILAKNDLGEGIVATPALVDNKIYVRGQRHLYAFGD